MNYTTNINIYLIFIIIILLFLYLNKLSTSTVTKNYYVYPNKHTKSLKIDPFIKPKSLSNNVIFFMSIDYPEIPQYGLLSIKILKDYCNKHKYTFKLYNNYGKNNISPYWMRVKDLHDILNNYNYDTIIYFDLDVVINSNFFNSPIDLLLDSINTSSNHVWDMYLATDPFYLNYEMNTGIIIIKNNNWTKKFIDLWYSNYPQDFWTKNNDKWNCSINSSKCIWAGEEYEQGMLNRLYSRNLLNCKEHIIPVSYNIFGNNSIDENCYILHFMGMSDSNRLKNIITLYPNENYEYLNQDQDQGHKYDSQ